MSMVFAAAEEPGQWTGRVDIHAYALHHHAGRFLLCSLETAAEATEARTEMLNAIKKGDRIVTVGGIHGEVTNAKGDEITVRIADKVEIRLSRSGVGHVK